MLGRPWLLAGAIFFGLNVSQVGYGQVIGADGAKAEQLLLAIVANGHPLSDGVVAFQGFDRAVYLPVGEITRLLGFGMSVDQAGRVANGTGNASSISIDAAARSITTAKGTRHLSADGIHSEAGEIYVRAELLQVLFGLKIETDLPGLIVTIASDSQLPFELEIERLDRREQLRQAKSREMDAGPVKEAPYQLLTPPALDLIVRGDRVNDSYGGRTELRAAGDLLFGGYQLFMSGDARFRKRNLRFTIDRRNLDGELLGMTRIAAGDVFTPSLALGPRSNSGRGFTISNEPHQSFAVFDKLDMRGELPTGWEVELYINGLLSGSQASSANGQYEFQDVPLSYGQNALRLKFYGPNGEQRDEVRRIAVGGGQVPEGRLIYNLGAVIDGRPLFDLGHEQLSFRSRVKGLNYAANARYGIEPWLTLTAGLGTYEPWPTREQRVVATVGARAALASHSLQIDGAFDLDGGSAISAAIAGPMLGGSIVARHTEYTGEFVDEMTFGPGASRVRRRSTDMRFNHSVHLGRLTVPIGLMLARDVLSDGTPIFTGLFRTSIGWDHKRLSLALGYRADLDGLDRIEGTADLYLGDWDRWRMRGSLQADLAPEAELRVIQLTAERSFGIDKQLSFGVSRSFGAFSATSLNSSMLRRTRHFDLSLNAGYQFERNELFIGGQVAFAFVHDPLRGRYVATKPGATATAALALNAFQDLDGDGVRQAGEPGVRGVTAVTGSYLPAETDADGYALAPGIGSGLVPVRVTAETSDELMDVPADLRFRAASRPGAVIVIDYPVAFESDVAVRPVIRSASATDDDGQMIGLKLALVSTSGRRFVQTTTDDGYAYFSKLPPGAYRVEVDAGQAAANGGRADPSILIVAPPEGGSLNPIDVEIGASMPATP